MAGHIQGIGKVVLREYSPAFWAGKLGLASMIRLLESEGWKVEVKITKPE